MMAMNKMRGMLLSDLLSGFDLHDPVAAIQISDIASNSADVTPNSEKLRTEDRGSQLGFPSHRQVAMKPIA